MRMLRGPSKVEEEKDDEESEEEKEIVFQTDNILKPRARIRPGFFVDMNKSAML